MNKYYVESLASRYQVIRKRPGGAINIVCYSDTHHEAANVCTALNAYESFVFGSERLYEKTKEERCSGE